MDLAFTTPQPPSVIDQAADLRFADLAASLGLDPADRFVGGYVAWEWQRSRHLFDGLVERIENLRVLEVGCNVGGTTVVLAALGARVTAVEPDRELLELARANVARHGLSDRVRLIHVPDTRRLPFAASSFDWASCNSVLEYVPTPSRPALLRELDRVLRPGGVLAILGSSNRLWPREEHSGRWLVHYLPRAIDPLVSLASPKPIRRGVSPGSLLEALPGYTDELALSRGRRYRELKRRMGAPAWKLGFAAALGALGLPPGLAAPTLSLALRKPISSRV